MGTRGAITFVIDGQEKTTYNHWDSYPSGLGASVLSWLTTSIEKGELPKTRNQATALRLVNEQDEPSAEERDEFSRFSDGSVSTGSDWYAVLRNCQGKPGLILEAGVAGDGMDFPRDSLFCEWAYVIDFDQDVFEVYQGFQQAPPTQGRWVGADGMGRGYYPVNRIASWSFDDLPDHEAFLKIVEPDEEEDED